ncbi:MAG: hypothetical protein MJD61_06740 [Proteobacteria bacterium]|nr:hypothetical protein [Pseudomonadota bacterium]
MRGRMQGAVACVAVLGSVAAAAGFWGWSLDQRSPAPNGPPPQAPESPFAAVSDCGHDGTRAVRRALGAEAQGSSLAERYAFDPGDGVDAVRLLSLAERCYDAAGRSDDVARMRRSLAQLEAMVLADYKRTLLRLRYFLRRGQHAQAKAEAQSLRRMLLHRSGIFRGWLDRIVSKSAKPAQPAT